MKNTNILVCDDQPFLRNLLSQIVRDNWPAANVSTACNGSEALGELTHKDFDVLFIDIEMPFMTGLEVLTEMRKNELSSQTKVVLCTGCKGESVPIQALDLNVDYYLPKPFEMHEVGMILDEIRWGQSSEW